MNLNKISKLIRTKRKEIGITQEELANRLFVTEKAVSRWETGRGTPDISLLIPLARELKIDVAELLSGEEKQNVKNDVEQIIYYQELTNEKKFNVYFKFITLFYFLSILTFLVYLRFEYDPMIELNYFIRLFTVFTSSIFIFIANKIYENEYVEKLENKNKVRKFSQWLIFVYYFIFLFNMVIFARYNEIRSYNIIPFKSIIEHLNSKSYYSVLINVLGNFVIFMPLEYFLLELFNIRKFPLNIIIAFCFILIVEIAQYIFAVGVFDIDDIILCIAGMITFYWGFSKYKPSKKS